MARRGKVQRTRNIQHTANKARRKSGPANYSARVDYRATFLDFCKTHGGHMSPVLYRQRLLFPDGWQFSSTSYRGPYWPAPSQPVELARLKQAYFALRKRALKEELFYLGAAIERIINAWNAVGQKPRVKNELRDGDGKVIGEPVIEVDLDALFARKAEWEADLENCEREIDAAKEIIRKQKHGPHSSNGVR